MKDFSFRIIVTCALLVLVTSLAKAATYYLSATGNNSRSKTSVGEAWATIAMVNSKKFYPGDVIHFEGGKTFSGKFKESKRLPTFF